MKNNRKKTTNWYRRAFILSISIILSVVLLSACSTSNAVSETVGHIDFDYTPLTGDDWEVSTPAAEGLDSEALAELYESAADLDTIYSLLVIQNGKLIAEKYFNEGSVDQNALLQSASKSYASALVGISMEQGCLTSLDQKLMDFFPEYVDQITDPRKMEITIRDLLQMRSGFPWEETNGALMEALFAGDHLPMIVHFPLVSDPGTKFNYSNITPHILGVIVSRACDTDLKSFTEEYLLSPIDAELGEIWQDPQGYYYPFFSFTARDMAKFGLLYLNDGIYDGKQVISADWVHDSLQIYSQNAWTNRVGRNFKDIGYGYQWWSVRAGDHRYSLAWGHGGQQIVLLDAYEMVIVLTADPFYGQHDSQSWKHERANLNLIADFIESLP